MKYKGEIEGFPKEIVERMLEEQKKQGNNRDVCVFEKYAWAGAISGGFNWASTIEGEVFWNSIIEGKQFDLFFEKYPKDSVNNNYEIF